MKEPNIIDVREVVRGAEMSAARISTGEYVPARPLAGFTSRWRAAWLVFTGRADALTWPEQ